MVGRASKDCRPDRLRRYERRLRSRHSRIPVFKDAVAVLLARLHLVFDEVGSCSISANGIVSTNANTWGFGTSDYFLTVKSRHQLPHQRRAETNKGRERPAECAVHLPRTLRGWMLAPQRRTRRAGKHGGLWHEATWRLLVKIATDAVELQARY
jgi:hypothetical protein